MLYINTVLKTAYNKYVYLLEYQKRASNDFSKNKAIECSINFYRTNLCLNRESNKMSVEYIKKLRQKIDFSLKQGMLAN